MEEMTSHERCSELLAPYLRGELDDDTARAVAAHLDDCRECGAERRGLVALQSPQPEPLTEMERARMRRVVMEVAVPAPDAEAVPTRSPDRRARLLPLLGAAALVAIIAVFAFTDLANLSGSDSGGSAAVSDGEGDAEDPETEGGDVLDSAGDAMGEESTALEATGGGSGGTATGSGSQNRAKAPSPTFRASIGEVDRARLNKLGRQGLPLVLFSRAFSVEDVPRLRDDFVEQMADRAPTARGNQIRECAATITSQFPNALPAYSAIGYFAERPQREVLVIAFAWTDEPEGPLDQSMVWAWPLGTCGSVAHYSKNVVEPQR